MPVEAPEARPDQGLPADGGGVHLQPRASQAAGGEERGGEVQSR